MELVTPSVGLIFWTTVTFLLLLILLRKFAWKPILAALHQREKSIEDALNAAERAKHEVSHLHEESDRLLKDARTEREFLLKEAKIARDQILSDAKDQAKTEGRILIEKAQEEIIANKNAALSQIKAMVASLSIEISEKILEKDLENTQDQKDFMTKQLKDLKLN